MQRSTVEQQGPQQAKKTHGDPLNSSDLIARFSNLSARQLREYYDYTSHGFNILIMPAGRSDVIACLTQVNPTPKTPELQPSLINDMKAWLSHGLFDVVFFRHNDERDYTGTVTFTLKCVDGQIVINLGYLYKIDTAAARNADMRKSKITRQDIGKQLEDVLTEELSPFVSSRDMRDAADKEVIWNLGRFDEIYPIYGVKVCLDKTRFEVKIATSPRAVDERREALHEGYVLLRQGHFGDAVKTVSPSPHINVNDADVDGLLELVRVFRLLSKGKLKDAKVKQQIWDEKLKQNIELTMNALEVETARAYLFCYQRAQKALRDSLLREAEQEYETIINGRVKGMKFAERRLSLLHTANELIDLKSISDILIKSTKLPRLELDEINDTELAKVWGIFDAAKSISDAHVKESEGKFAGVIAVYESAAREGIAISPEYIDGIRQIASAVDLLNNGNTKEAYEAAKRAQQKAANHFNIKRIKEGIESLIAGDSALEGEYDSHATATKHYIKARCLQDYPSISPKVIDRIESGISSSKIVNEVIGAIESDNFDSAGDMLKALDGTRLTNSQLVYALEETIRELKSAKKAWKPPDWAATKRHLRVANEHIKTNIAKDLIKTIEDLERADAIGISRPNEARQIYIDSVHPWVKLYAEGGLKKLSAREGDKIVEELMGVFNNIDSLANKRSTAGSSDPVGEVIGEPTKPVLVGNMDVAPKPPPPRIVSEARGMGPPQPVTSLVVAVRVDDELPQEPPVMGPATPPLMVSKPAEPIPHRAPPVVPVAKVPDAALPPKNLEMLLGKSYDLISQDKPEEIILLLQPHSAYLSTHYMEHPELSACLEFAKAVDGALAIKALRDEYAEKMSASRHSKRLMIKSKDRGSAKSCREHMEIFGKEATGRKDRIEEDLPVILKSLDSVVLPAFLNGKVQGIREEIMKIREELQIAL